MATQQHSSKIYPRELPWTEEQQRHRPRYPRDMPKKQAGHRHAKRKSRTKILGKTPNTETKPKATHEGKSPNKKAESCGRPRDPNSRSLGVAASTDEVIGQFIHDKVDELIVVQHTICGSNGLRPAATSQSAKTNDGPLRTSMAENIPLISS